MNNPIKFVNAVCATLVALFIMSPVARAVDPPPVGGYPGDNTAVGDDALFSLTTGIHNTAGGYSTLYFNTTGFNNTAIGWDAMISNNTGNKNVAVGCDGMVLNTTGSNNTVVGTLALSKSTRGNTNTAFGYQAGANLTNGNNNVYLASPGAATENNTIHIGSPQIHGATFIAGISGATVADGVSVVVGADGRLGTIVSSGRYKEAIKPMGQASEAILALQPVTFRYKEELDHKGIPQFGLVAEQVEKVNRDLVARDDQGKPYTVRYEAVNAMLLNEFLKAHRKLEEQAEINEQQQATIIRLEAALKKQAAQIQKVSEKLEMSKPSGRLVTND